MFESVNFPGWEVVRKIGEGSFGGVYEIQRKLPDGRVETAALKKMSIPRDQEEVYVLQSQSFSGEQITACFKKQMGELVREYLFMQKLSGCPNVVSCQDVRYSPHEDGIGWDIYIRMELLTPLKKYVTGQYSEYQVLRLGLDICRALAACEKQNIIHRDIKPQNILVSENRTYKLADFGIAKVSEKTESGTMAGTNGYIAPEVANRQKYGKEVDIYSLGMVLYWLMNDNTLPFLPLPPQIPTAEQRDLAAQQRLDGVPLPPPINGSAALKSVVCKACAFDPAARYRSAVEFGSALLKLYRQQKPMDSDDILQEIGLTRDMLNGEEPIEWLILEKNDNQYLVISKYGLDSQKYHDQWEVVTWETCRLRVWLNQTFYSAAFNPAEQDMIMTSDVYSESPTHSYPSRTVQDKVFLLDCRESYRYFKSEKARTCIATQYAIDQGSTVQYGGTCWRWLREGYFVDLASIPNLQRANFTDSGGTVRPVMWVDAG